MQGTYSFWLVSLSLLIAMLASYTVLDLTAFISFLERPRLKHAWLAGGAAAMGIGIWSMHFIGMLAFSLPIPLGYNLTITGASLALAVVASYFALSVVVRPDLSFVRLLGGGILLGLGVAGMHYAGMAAMEMQPGITYKPLLVATSVAIAIVPATAALWIANALSAPSRRYVMLKRLGASAVMGLAITGMHYTGMAAAEFLPGTVCGAANGISTSWLATTVTMMTLIILLVTLVVSRFDAHTAFLRRMTQTLEAQIDRRTGELHGSLHEHRETTAALEATREQMHAAMAGQEQARARLTQDNEAQRRLITELEEKYAQLQRSAKLASIAHIAAGVSHEINEPIHAISANLNFIKMRVEQMQEAVLAQQPLMETIEHESLHGAQQQTVREAVREAFREAVMPLEVVGSMQAGNVQRSPSHHPAPDSGATDAPMQLAVLWKATDMARLCSDTLAMLDDAIANTVKVRRIGADWDDFFHPGKSDAM